MELVYELRIGNLVSKSLKSGNGRTLIDKVGPQDIVRIYENISHFNYHPIEITKEWLLKFGFYQDHYDDDFTKYCIVFEDIELKFYIYYNGNKKICFGKLTIMCKYVHQIQNLYFILTGKELTYPDVI
jgi:hypothetical protein